MRTAVAVVPLRDGRSGKTRLSAVLGAEDRARLVAALARHVVTTLAEADGVSRVVVISADVAFARAALVTVRGPVEVVQQPPDRRGLNAAIAFGRDGVAARPSTRLLVAHADLPALAPDDVVALLAQPGPVTIAPDRAGTGTNALVLDRAAAEFTFRFGVGSLAAHRQEAARRGWTPALVTRTGTAVDLDTPEDWLALPDVVRARVRDEVPAMANLSAQV